MYIGIYAKCMNIGRMFSKGNMHPYYAKRLNVLEYHFFCYLKQKLMSYTVVVLFKNLIPKYDILWLFSLIFCYFYKNGETKKDTCSYITKTMKQTRKIL